MICFYTAAGQVRADIMSMPGSVYKLYRVREGLDGWTWASPDTTLSSKAKAAIEQEYEAHVAKEVLL